ncbi:MAG: hypothetical protein A3J58_01240 [Candidatus Sungbacteria bacterium RIFCSPHIGHO2_02_FULL_52_23]|uniref:Uncharacterized protein n=1 Tax=Candidatus Sungbacteria bacterium RIFCSPHIGHO2_02_FULL_52_23 TaxID=1802274 RepID=A0A1G2KV83_9BACT|nr:MAG: hypothetical protein A3J58_01240 [Candidatus Sungbacteria bacterium RIFCSPHIGHO2_02_FULL_52_23]
MKRIIYSFHRAIKNSSLIFIGHWRFFRIGVAVVLVFSAALMLGANGTYLFMKNDGSRIEKDKEAARACLVPDKVEKLKCLNDLLIRVTEQYGIKPALDIIEPLSEEHSELLEWSHPFSHTIGNHGLTYYSARGVSLEQQIGRALVECDGYGAFGCYHGIIETGLALLPVEKRASVIRASCMENPLVTEKQYFVNQCLHWFGHGVAIFANLTLTQALAMCDGLGPFESDGVQLCLSGLFHAGPVPGHVDDALLTKNISNVWKEGDPYYPCADIEEKFRGHCYSHAAGRTLSNDLNVGFRTCDNIPEPDPKKRLDYISRCYESQANTLLAQILNDQTLNDSQKIGRIVSDCKIFATPAYRKFCYAGASRYWVLRDPLLTNKNPFEICRRVEPDAKPFCYANIGFGNNENYYSPEKLAAYCEQSEPGYVQYCTRREASLP